MKAHVEFIGGLQDGQEKSISRTSSIGRDETCDICIASDRFVSKKHARLRLWNEGYILEDLGSSNGTFINDKIITSPVLLSNGQLFKVGKTIMKINYD